MGQIMSTVEISVAVDSLADIQVEVAEAFEIDVTVDSLAVITVEVEKI